MIAKEQSYFHRNGSPVLGRAACAQARKHTCWEDTTSARLCCTQKAWGYLGTPTFSRKATGLSAPCLPYTTMDVQSPVILSFHLVKFCPGQCRTLARSWLIMEKGRSDNISTSPLAPLASHGSGVLPVMFASCDSKLGSALIAVGAITPRRLLRQHICNTGRRRLVSVSDC